MGKKSRKAGKKSNKKEHKDRLNERQSRIEEQQYDTTHRQQQHESESIQNNDREREAQVLAQSIFTGDRVWFWDDCTSEWGNHQTYRGIVKNVLECGISGNKLYSILPIAAAEDTEEYRARVPSRYVVPDKGQWTLRYKMDEKVVCRTDNGWLPCKVCQLFPIDYLKDQIDIDRRELPRGVPAYRCEVDIEYESTHVMAPYDEDNCIKKHPTNFRFSVGDVVRFATEKASTASKRHLKSGWPLGIVSSVDILGMEDYAVYECKLTNARGNRNDVYFISKDDDAHITSAAATPRERLLDAIEQNCHIDHFIYLLDEYEIDVTSFQDLVLSTAIEFGNYWVLLWLQEKVPVNLGKQVDVDGNGVLNQISMSIHAEKFVSTAGYLSFQKKEKEKYGAIELIYETGNDICLCTQQNNAGDIFIHKLISRGNVRALDLFLSPWKFGFGWELQVFLTRIKHYANVSASSLVEFATKMNQVEMAKIIEEFNTFQQFLDHWYQLGFWYKTNESEFIKTVFKFDSPEIWQRCDGLEWARRFIRSYDSWKGYHSEITNRSTNDIAIKLAEKGFFAILHSLLESDPYLLQSRSIFPSQSNLNDNEFIQIELYSKEGSEERKSNYFDLISISVHGKRFYFDPNDDDRKCYMCDLYCFVMGKVADLNRRKDILKNLEGIENVTEEEKVKYMEEWSHKQKSWYEVIKQKQKTKNESYSSWMEIHNYKISLMEDNSDLQNRLKVLDYLIEKCCSPDTLDPIRFRQCGVLRWMVKKSLIDLNAAAKSDKCLVKYSRKIQFLGSRNIPASTTIAEFLCFAAVEFDDLQSLQWIIKENEMDLELLHINKWNILHAVAFFGRLEILAWLLDLKAWTSFFGTPCGRKPWENSYAVHIAIDQGHLDVAKILLCFGSQEYNTFGRTPVDCAKDSEFDHVREWGNEEAEREAKPIQLGKDINNFFQYLHSGTMSVTQLRTLYLKHRCLDYDVWIDAGYSSSNMSGPNLKNYVEILTEISSCPHHDFAIWLFSRLSRRRVSACDPHLDGCQYYWDSEDFWGSSQLPVSPSILQRNTLTTDKDILNWLAKPFANKIVFHEPYDTSPMLRELRKGEKMQDFCELVRQKILILNVIETIMSFSGVKKHLHQSFIRGDQIWKIEELCQVFIDASHRLCHEVYANSEDVFDEYYNRSILAEDGSINLKGKVYLYKYEDSCPAKKMSLIRHARDERQCLAYILAVEGHSDLIRWCMSLSKDCDARVEAAIIHIAAYFGHSSILDFFLSEGHSFEMSRDDRIFVATLGAAESGRASDLQVYLHIASPPNDVLISEFSSIPTFSITENYEKVHKSLAIVVVSGYLHCRTSSDNDSRDLNGEWLNTLGLVLNIKEYDAKILLYAAELVLDKCYKASYYHAFLTLYSFLQSRGLEIWDEKVQKILHRITEKLTTGYIAEEEREKILPVVSSWLQTLSSLGVSIQSDEYLYSFSNILKMPVQLAQKRQVATWAQFDIIKQNTDLSAIQKAVEVGDVSLDARDQGGMLPIHIAAAYDRSDVLEWLVKGKGTDLDAIDGKGRTVLQVAEASKARTSAKWIKERKAKAVISSFVSAHFYRKLAVLRARHMISAVIMMQALYRGRLVRKAHRAVLLRKLGETQQFELIWNQSIALLSNLNDITESSWASMRSSKFDLQLAGVKDIEDIDQVLGEAVNGALDENPNIVDDINTSTSDNEDFQYDINEEMTKKKNDRKDVLNFNITALTKIQLSSAVVKWLKVGDPKYRSFFVRRMKQLSSGDRSRILAKRLKGSNSLVYESYLEQKSGFRILWTPPTSSTDNLIVWYVARHKNVSRLVQLIDDSQRRSTKYVRASELPEFTVMLTAKDEIRIILNPLGNTPLKLYEIPLDAIDAISSSSWNPKLRLTTEERDIVEAKGTVLLLGRSGTGKTICICNRLDYDRERFSHDASFTQLFIARSSRLCRYVEGAVGIKQCSTFTTFREFLISLETVLPKLCNGDSRIFRSSQHVDYARFKREIFKQTKIQLDPLVVWTNIRTFIKGSIEATNNSHKFLSREEYVEKLGKKRCRLTTSQRDEIYAMFLKYQDYINELSLWDDCDRIIDLLYRVIEIKSSDPDLYRRVKKSKIYVDEIQDYTQVECLLFFQLSGPGDLFLAGDPAQAVVEGTEFRFEDIRSVGHHIAGPHRNLIPQKPKTVNINFRSHSGILKLAAAILKCLFNVFPDSTKQLKEDQGIFHGPRPGVFYKVPLEQLSSLLSDKLNGAIVLTHDSISSQLKLRLGYPLVYGFIEAKGLEFRTVIILNFFAGLPSPMQKPWRDLLLGRAGEIDFHICHPEIECHLKKLYTSVTRCIEKLYFVESTASTSGDAFVRWACTTSIKSEIRKNPGTVQEQERQALATCNNIIQNIDAMNLSADEWVTSAFTNAEIAESNDEGNFLKMISLFDRAIYCFEQAKIDSYASKARAHRDSIHLRMLLDSASQHNAIELDDIVDIETKAAHIFEKLVTEKLLNECRAVCLAIIPHLPPHSREQLEARVLPKLQA